jgi:DNA repair exonuclease SbcCD nuclease subunit
MVRFAHFADCHLGSWRQPELQDLNFASFQKAVDQCIEEKVDFILIAGDLFDSAYPPIEILKETFSEFKRIKEANIPVFLIAGSHDFSASGKTFLDVLEKGGFCKNIENFEVQEDGRIKLNLHIFGEVALVGYPGRKSGMEIEDLKKVYFDHPNQYTIFMIHTTISDVVGNIPMDSVDKLKLPLADYYAMGHIHQVFKTTESGTTFSYPGPIYPNNFQELADLKFGSFNMCTLTNRNLKVENVKIPIKEVVYKEIEIDNGLTATERIIDEIDRIALKNKIFLMKLRGTLTQGKTGDIRFDEIEEFVKKKEAYVFLRNISAVKIQETEVEIESEDVENIEEKIVEEYVQKDPTDFNKFLSQLINALAIEKNEDEKSNIFETRLMDEVKHILNLEGEL